MRKMYYKYVKCVKNTYIMNLKNRSHMNLTILNTLLRIS
jgi:hypothetical protein